MIAHLKSGGSVTATSDVVKRNMAALPIYTLMLGLLALLGFVAIAAGITPLVSDGKPDMSTIVPTLFDRMFPSWFAGVAFAMMVSYPARAASLETWKKRCDQFTAVSTVETTLSVG